MISPLSQIKFNSAANQQCRIRADHLEPCPVPVPGIPLPGQTLAGFTGLFSHPGCFAPVLLVDWVEVCPKRSLNVKI